MSGRRRRRLLLWSALPVLLALLLAAKLLSAAWFSGQASSAFARGDAPAGDPADSQLEQLREAGQSAQQERNRGLQREDYLKGTGSGPLTDKPW